MPQITVIAPTDAAVGSAAAETQRAFDLSHYKSGIISAILAGAEEVVLYKLIGPHWAPLVDSAGVAKKLTATIEMLVLEGGCRYGCTKTTTATYTANSVAGFSVGVYLDLGPELNS